MLGSASLDLAIGLVLFFLLVSLMCSAIREAGETFLKSRARDLESGLRMMLDDKDGTVTMPSLMSHGLMASLFQGSYNPNFLKSGWWDKALHLPPSRRGQFPSYIPSGHFAAALLDIVARGDSDGPYPGSTAPLTVAGIRQSVALLPSSRLRQVILGALDTAGNDLDRARAEIEKWFDGSMDRVCGWYKRRTQFVLFFIGLAVAIVLNLDALTVAAHLVQDDKLRAAAVAQAETIKLPEAGKQVDISGIQKAFTDIGYPIGWQVAEGGYGAWPGPQACKTVAAVPDKTVPAVQDKTVPAGQDKTVPAGQDTTTPAIPGSTTETKVCSFENLGLYGALSKLVGWGITALAVTLGAPFWFDLLNKFMSFRSTIKPKDEAAIPDDTDKQATPAAAATVDAAGQPAAIIAIGPQVIASEIKDWKSGFINQDEVAL